MMCDCKFAAPESSWHYKRTCKNCGNIWYGLHCPHDGVQNPCPKCDMRPVCEEPHDT